MITLFGWGPMFECPSPSPYVMKTEIQLQMLGLEFDRAIADLDAVSKQKAPYVTDDGELIEDSNFIRAHFEKKLGRRMDAGLSVSQMATAWAVERMVEGHVNSIMAMERWLIPENFEKGPKLFFMGAPEEMRQAIIEDMLGKLQATYYGTGLLRHSREERMELAGMDLASVSMTLGDKPFLFGDEPRSADASVYGVVKSCSTEFFETPLTAMVRKFDNLLPYLERMEARFFAENRWPAMG